MGRIVGLLQASNEFIFRGGLNNKLGWRLKQKRARRLYVGRTLPTLRAGIGICENRCASEQIAHHIAWKLVSTFQREHR